jgi:hypothetical protein
VRKKYPFYLRAQLKGEKKKTRARQVKADGGEANNNAGKTYQGLFLKNPSTLINL